MQLQMKSPVNFLLEVRINFLSYCDPLSLHGVLANGFQYIVRCVSHPLLRVSVRDTQRQHDAGANMGLLTKPTCRVNYDIMKKQ